MVDESETKRLFRGVLGKEMGCEMTVFQVSNTHEAAGTADCDSAAAPEPSEPKHIPYRCFGDFARKTERRMAEASQMPTADASSEPYVVGNIEVGVVVMEAVTCE